MTARYKPARPVVRAMAILLATVVTVSCATLGPEVPNIDIRPATPAEFEAPQRAAESVQEVTSSPPSDTAATAHQPESPASPATAKPLPEPRDAIEDRIDSLLATMTIEQKVGQRFMTWIPGTASSERTSALIKQLHIGGVFITEHNVESHQQARELIGELQRMAQAASPAIPLFIATDQEGGTVTRVRLPELTLFPAPFHQGKHTDTDYVEAAAYVTGIELRRLGVNMNLAPLLDLYGDADGTVINDRSYGTDSELIAEFARAYVRGADRAGIVAVAKHFPGHGVTTKDSHERLPVVRLTRSERSSNLAPFVAAIDEGIAAVMSAHIMYEGLDPDLPASVSPAIVTGLLRNQFAFDGVVITDAIEIREPSPALTEMNIVRNSFEAGTDIILAAREHDVLPLVQEAARLVRSGLESEDRLDASVRRILRVKMQTMMVP